MKEEDKIIIKYQGRTYQFFDLKLFGEFIAKNKDKTLLLNE